MRVLTSQLCVGNRLPPRAGPPAPSPGPPPVRGAGLLKVIGGGPWWTISVKELFLLPSDSPRRFPGSLEGALSQVPSQNLNSASQEIPTVLFPVCTNSLFISRYGFLSLEFFVALRWFLFTASRSFSADGLPVDSPVDSAGVSHRCPETLPVNASFLSSSPLPVCPPSPPLPREGFPTWLRPGLALLCRGRPQCVGAGPADRRASCGVRWGPSRSPGTPTHPTVPIFRSLEGTH